MSLKIGCLIIHGFGGHYDEIAPLDAFLKEKHFITLCPKLSAHEGTYNNFKLANEKNWYREVSAAYDRLSESVDFICIIGFSMGGLLALSLNQKPKRLCTVLLNAPIYQWDFKRILNNVYQDLRNKQSNHIQYYLKSMTKFPIEALASFKRLVWKIKKDLSQVTGPILICQGLLDDTVHPKSAKYLYNHLTNANPTIQYYNASDHLICHSPDVDTMKSDLLHFMTKCLNEAQ